MLDLKGTFFAFAVACLALMFLMRGCGNRMDKFREYRQQRYEQRKEDRQQRKEERQDRRDDWRERWQDRRFRFRR